MNLTPILTSTGQLRGHLNLDLCRQYRDSWIVDETAGRLAAFAPEENVSDTVRFFRFPTRKMRFRWGNGEQLGSYLVPDAPIPGWVWSAAGIKFGGVEDWEGWRGKHHVRLRRGLPSRVRSL